MKVSIDTVRVDPQTRIRTEEGDLQSLVSSIEAVGLINPILVDRDHRLIAGYRRLCACRSLGWKEIDVRVVAEDADPLTLLEIEAAENIYRKDFTQEELLGYEQRRRELIESMRVKPWYQRFWCWLRSLFVRVPG